MRPLGVSLFGVATNGAVAVQGFGGGGGIFLPGDPVLDSSFGGWLVDASALALVPLMGACLASREFGGWLFFGTFAKDAGVSFGLFSGRAGSG